MSQKLSDVGAVRSTAAPLLTSSTLLTPKEAARFLNLSVSWLAKRRLDGNGPAYIKMGGAVRYSQAALQQWTKGRQRLSTSSS